MAYVGKDWSFDAGGGLVFRPDYQGFITVPASTQIHHKKGRSGVLLYEKYHFLAVNDFAHRYIHDNPKESYERGWMLPR